MNKHSKRSPDGVFRVILSSAIAWGLIECGVSIQGAASQTLEEIPASTSTEALLTQETVVEEQIELATESQFSFATHQPLTAIAEDSTLDSSQLDKAIAASPVRSATRSPEPEAEIADFSTATEQNPSLLLTSTDELTGQIPVLPAPEPSPPPQTFGPENPVPPPGYSPPPFEFDYYNQFNRYRLGIGDNVAIAVQGFPEFDVQGPIDLEGNLVVPILGSVSLMGLTLEEVNAKISYELGQRYLQQEPNVTARLLNPRTSTITIAGEVFQPGFYNLAPGTEVDEAIITAGGSTRQADLRSVIVRRSLIDGTVIEREVNLFASLQNGTSLPPLRLQDGDAVIVPKLIVGTDQDYDRVLVSRSLLAQQQITIRVLSYPNQALGAITLANGSTFLDAITQLNLNLQEADLSEIGLLRFDPEQGKVVAQKLNGIEAIRGDISQDVPLLDDDVIVVDRSTLSAIDYVLGIVTRPVTSILQLINFVRDTLIFSVPDVFNPPQQTP